MNDNADGAVHWPAYSYVPGFNQRHSEDAFDSVKAGISAAMSVDELAECSAFQHGLLYLNGGYYWEAHEVFEPVWMSLPADSDEKRFVQALIQVANACLKHRMQRPNASLRLCDIAKHLLAGVEAKEMLGVQKASVLAIIVDLEQKL